MMPYCGFLPVTLPIFLLHPERKTRHDKIIPLAEMVPMKNSRYTGEQIPFALKQA